MNPPKSAATTGRPVRTAPAAARRGAPARATPAVLPLQRQTVASLTLDAIREHILRGTYREGQPLRQDALAIELGVSRIPIREALRQLEAEGLVTFSPHRGAIVSSLSLAEIDEVFSLRAHIECDLLRRAIPLLGAEQFAVVDEVLDRYERALKGGDVAAWGELNRQFHSTLYAPANRPVTMGVVRRLLQHSDRYSRMHIALTHSQTRANDEHRAIAQAARQRDVKKACRLLHEHIIGAGRALLVFLRERRAGQEGSRRGEARA